MALPQKIIYLSPQTVQFLTSVDPGKRVTDVIKELIENSIDANSTSITIIIENGGYSSIKVIDNGCGILKESLPDACRYHATSKIRNYNDLKKLESFGFSGSALAHFSCISKIVIASKTESEPVATCCNYLFNVPINFDKREMSKGTMVELKDLLYNYPEIRRNRKKDSIEALKVKHIVIKYAIIFTNISFTIYSNYTPKNSSKYFEILKSNDISQVLTKLKIQNDVDIPFIHYDTKESIHEMNIEFYLSNFMAEFQNPIQGIYLNRRLISCPPIKEAVGKIYKYFRIKNNIPDVSKSPYFIMISIPKDKIDIRRHYSTKRVVFQDQDKLISDISKVVKSELSLLEQYKSKENMPYDSASSSALAKSSASSQTRSSSNSSSSLIIPVTQSQKSSASTMTQISFKNESNPRTEIKNLIEPSIPRQSNIDAISSAVSAQKRNFLRTVVVSSPRSSTVQQENNSIMPQQPVQVTKDDGKLFHLNESNILNTKPASQQSSISHLMATNPPSQQQRQPQHQIIQTQQHQQRRQQHPSPLIQSQVSSQYTSVQNENGVEIRRKKIRSNENRTELQSQMSNPIIQQIHQKKQNINNQILQQQSSDSQSQNQQRQQQQQQSQISINDICIPSSKVFYQDRQIMQAPYSQNQQQQQSSQQQQQHSLMNITDGNSHIGINSIVNADTNSNNVYTKKKKRKDNDPDYVPTT